MLFWISLFLVGMGCSKTTPDKISLFIPKVPTAQAKLYPVHFKVGNIQSYNQRIAAKEIAVKEYLRYIYYAAYDSAGRQVKRIEQNFTMGDTTRNELGVINDSLPSGMYTIVMIGAINAPSVRDADSLLSKMSFYSTGSDLFFKKFTVNVGDSYNGMSTVKLDRISGRLQLKLTDSLPPEVTALTLLIAPTLPLYYFPAADTAGEFGSIAADILHYDLDVIGSDKKHQVVIHALDKDGMKLYQKIIKDVVIRPNQLTILRGSLMNSDSLDASSGTSFTFDPDYGEPIIKNF